jgi:HlyD family secretion protein
MTIRTRIYALAVFLAVLAVGAYAFYSLRDAHQTDGHIVLYGNVDVRQVNLAFKVPGRLGAVNVEEGDNVRAGELLAILEPQDYEDEVSLSRARVRGQTAELAALQTGTRPQQIDQAAALLAEANATLALAENTLKRQQFLADRDFVSPQGLETAVTGRDRAAAAKKVAEEALKLARIGPRFEDIEQSRAALNAEQAALNLSQRRLKDSNLIAPTDGRVLTRVREPGSIVGAGETIVSVSLVSPIWVRAYLAEPDLDRVEPGMKAEVQTDSGGIYSGKIGFISPVAEFTPKTVETPDLRTSLVYRVRIIVEDPRQRLKQGMPVTVILKPAAQR